MADVARTVQNTRGDVITYVRHQGKHTLFTFDAESGDSYFETLTNTDQGVWAYLAVNNAGPVFERFPETMALDTVTRWSDTQKFADWLMEEF